MTTTPRELAAQLGVTPLRVRTILRAKYRPNGENKNARWVLDEEMVAFLREHVQR